MNIIELDGRRLPLNSRQRLYPFNGSLTIDPLAKSIDACLYTTVAKLIARQSLQLNIILGKFHPSARQPRPSSIRKL